MSSSRLLTLALVGALSLPVLAHSAIPYESRLSVAGSDLDKAMEDFICAPPEDDSEGQKTEDNLFDENQLPDIIARHDEGEAAESEEDLTDGSSPAEDSELDAWRAAVKRFEERSLEFASEVSRVISRKYEEEIRELRGGYDVLINRANEEEKLLRDLAIESLEAFVRDHPDSPYTARRMVRLAELYFEESKEEYLAANDEYSDLSDAFDRGEVEFLPEPPETDLRRSIALYKRIIKKFPAYEDLGVVYYMLGFCYSDEQSRHLDPERAEATYLEMLENVDESAYRAQAYFRLGEIYFDENRLDEALSYYRSIVQELEAEGIEEDDTAGQRLYELSLYKLAWAYYKIDDLPVAIARFKSLLDWAEQKEARTGVEADLKPETIRYLAISLSDLAVEYDSSPIVFTQQQLADRPDSPWVYPVFVELASILKDQARFEEAIEAYAYLQEANPNHPRGPEFMWQIIGLNQSLVIPDQDAADRARIELTNRYGRDSAWMVANKNNKTAINLARDYILQSLQFVAFGYHSKAQETGDPTDYRLAAEKYVEYLDQYPFAPNAYELHYYLAECYFFIGENPVDPSRGAESEIGWERAIEVYGSLFNFPEDDFRKEAIVNIMYAYNLLWKHKEGDIQQTPESLAKLDPPLGEKVQYSRVEISDLEKNYIRSVRWLQREVPESPDIPTVLYDVGQIYFYKNHLERARSVFMFLIENHPKTNFAAFAAGDIINSYRWTGDLTRMRDAGERFAMLDLGEDPEIAETRNSEVQALAKQSLAKEGELAYAFERYECALLSFLEYYKLYGRDGTSKEPGIIDTIIYNIALSYSKLGKAADSDRYYRVLLADFPHSERAPNTFWKMAQNAEQVFNLEEAIQYYLELRRYHPGHKDVANALLNAGFLAVGLEQYGLAAGRYEEYHDLYTEDEKSRKYLFRAAELWESAGNRGKAKRIYERWLDLYGDTEADAWVETQWKLAEFAREAKKTKEADRRIALIDESYLILKPTLLAGGPGGNIAAGIRFESHITAYEEYAAFKITNIEDPEVGLAQIERKAAWHSEIIQMMDDFTVEYSDFEWQTAALYYRALSFQNHADTWLESPNPYDGDSDDDEEIERFDKYQEVLEQRIEELGLEEAAINAFKLVVEQASAKKRYTPWVDRALQELNRVDPNTYPVPKPERSTVVPADSMELPALIEKAPGISSRQRVEQNVRFASREEGQ